MSVAHSLSCCCVTHSLLSSVLHCCSYPLCASSSQITVYTYDDEEWESLIESDAAWSRAETDYLLDLCRRFDLRFFIIADRYEVCEVLDHLLPMCVSPILNVLNKSRVSHTLFSGVTSVKI